MRGLVPSLLCALLAVAPAPAPRADDPTDPRTDGFDSRHVAGSVTMLRTDTEITNSSVCASVGDDGTLLVDASFPKLGHKLVETVRGLGGGDVRFVISTHHHWDHSWGNEFHGAAGAVIIGHPELRELLRREPLPDDSGRTLDPAGLPAITTQSSLTLHFNSEAIEVTALPRGGHTGGDMVVWFARSKVLCAGDYYFAGKYPIIDREAGGSLEGYLANADRLLATYPPDAKIVPGHDTFPPEDPGIHTLADYGRWISSLKDSIAWIRSRLAAGLTAEEIEREGLPERFAPLGAKPRFVSEARWIAFVAESSP